MQSCFSLSFAEGAVEIGHRLSHVHAHDEVIRATKL